MTPLAPNPALVPPGVAPVGAPHPAAPPGGFGAAPVTAFQDVLRGQSQGVQFSAHALQRAERRGIDLGPVTLARLDAGVDRAASKGSREAVVFVDGTAFVVSIANNTVITAVDREHMRKHVFTNIDSAVIA